MTNPVIARSPSQRAIDDAFFELKKYDVTTEEYSTVLERIVKLQKIQEAGNPTPTPVSKDTLILAATNLIGIIMILRHEELNVITSKAMAFVPKPR